MKTAFRYRSIAPLGLLAAAPAFAAEAPFQASTTEISNRMNHRLGFYLGVNEPTPVMVGVNAAYHLTDFMRTSIGFGKVATASVDFGLNLPEASATTMGLGTRFFVPGWNITPSAGLGYSHVSYSGVPGMVEVGGFKDSGGHVYASLGADYQARSGFNASAGLQNSFKSGIGMTAYVTAGWYVDWL